MFTRSKWLRKPGWYFLFLETLSLRAVIWQFVFIVYKHNDSTKGKSFSSHYPYSIIQDEGNDFYCLRKRLRIKAFLLRSPIHANRHLFRISAGKLNLLYRRASEEKNQCLYMNFSLCFPRCLRRKTTPARALIYPKSVNTSQNIIAVEKKKRRTQADVLHAQLIKPSPERARVTRNGISGCDG